MATTKKKTKSTASKAQTGRKKSTASARDKSTGAKRSTTSRKRAPAKRKDYRPRLIGGAICFALAVFSAFGYFGIDAVVIRLLVQLEQGLAGYGYWITPVMLLWASIILIFHDGMPVRLRTTAALAVPLLIGTLGQILLGSGEYAICYNGNELPAAGFKSGKVTLQVFLKGNLSTKANATISVSVKLA